MNLRNAAVSTLAVMVTGVAVASPQARSLPIDRWLVSDAFQPDSSAASRLDTDLLKAPGEPGVLPDRGQPAAGTTWRLHRDDEVSLVSLDELVPDVRPGTVVYAHAYVRLPDDRTLRFAWDGMECTAGRAWLNGRSVASHDVRARFGAGWNTILLKFEAGTCAFGYEAVLSSDVADDLAGVRVQASRPPGEVRTGPEPWIVPADVARISPNRRWSRDRLFATLEVGVTAWGRSPVSRVEIELRGAAEGRAEAQWLIPGETRVLAVPVRLDRLESVAKAGAIEARFRWEGAASEKRLVVSSERPAISDSIALDGWSVKSVAAESRAARIDDQLPNAAGWVLQGEWKVPEALSGRTLVLKTGSSPGDYRLNDTRTQFIGDGVTLCAPCTRGDRLDVKVRTTGAWTAMPVVRTAVSASR